MTEGLLYKELSYKTIGICMEVHSILGKGHSEIVYKDALEYEFKQAGIAYSREKQFKISYKDIILPHSYFADFVIENSIILEVKASMCIVDGHIKQSLNYLAASRLRLALLVNFGEDSLTHKRIVF
jgi:GxxExxY protein